MKTSSQSGQVMVLIAFGLVGLIGMAGLAIDGGRAYADQRSLEAAAEAGAHAGTYLLEKNWDGAAATFGSLTDAQVKAAAQTYAAYNGWNAAGGDTIFVDYVKADRITHFLTLDNTARGVEVRVGKPQTATFTKVLGFQLYSDFARATAMFGSALVAGAIPFAVGDDCLVGYNVNFTGQPSGGSGSFGTCNFASIVPPGCIASDLACYTNAMANGMQPPVQLGPSYPTSGFDASNLSATTKAALQARISARPAETCTTFKSPSPRVVWAPVVPGGFGGSTVVFARYRAFFITSIEGSTPSKGFTGCFVHATINGGAFDPNAVGTAYGGLMIMKLVPSTDVVLPVTVNVTSITPSPIVRGASATLTIHTDQPGASCTALVFDLPPAPGQPSVAFGLGPKITDASGNTSWTWTVDATAIIGVTNVRITCSYEALIGYAFPTIVIT